MSDAIGGAVNIMFIAIFLVVVAGYMAFNISYMKAFKVKNRIIDLVEQYEGDCNPGTASTCTQKISDYMQQIGYKTKIYYAEEGYQCDIDKGYCIQEVKSDSSSAAQSAGNNKYYYKVATQVNIDIPVVSSIMPQLRIFKVTGESKTITKRT